MKIVVGIDSSTQSTKVEARRRDTGEVVATGSAPHPATTPPISEQDPTAWWSALIAAFGALGEHRTSVVAVSVAGQQHGLVLVDDNDEVLRPAKLWNDTSSALQAEQLVERLGPAQWAKTCGSVPLAAFTITKLAWVAEHEPGILERVRRVMLPHDYLTWRLTGRHVTDRGDASGTGWFDPTTDRYRPELLASLGLDESWLAALPQLLGPREPAGPIDPGAAAALGLANDVIVGPGTGDNMGAALGLGLSHGDVVVSLGTSGTVYARSAAATADASGAVAGFADATGAFLPLVCTLNATKVTDTVASWLGTDAAGLSSLALDAARTASPSASPPTLVPYFDGERTPNLPNATGSFVGLTNSTTREQLALAAHDGVLCGLLDGREALTSSGVAVGGSLYLVGGGARSDAYRQRLADLTNQSVVVPDLDEAVATGAAVQAAVVHDSVSETDVFERWQLGGGATTEPLVDAGPVREAYRQAISDH